MITTDEEALLKAIYTAKHPTTSEIHAHHFPQLSKRSVELKIKSLLDRGYIDAHLLYPEQGGRSPKYYHLLLKGARAIGLKKLGANHYREERREFYQVGSIKRQLKHIIQTIEGIRLHEEENMCRASILRYLQAQGKRQYGESFQTHTLNPLLPSQIKPDWVLETKDEAIILILAHPHSGRSFWRERLNKYQMLASHIRFLCIPLNVEMGKECEAVWLSSPHRSQFILLFAEQISEIGSYLHR